MKSHDDHHPVSDGNPRHPPSLALPPAASTQSMGFGATYYEVQPNVEEKRKGLRQRTSWISDTLASNDPTHPLRTAALTTSFNVAGITRPHLARMIHGTLVHDSSPEQDSQPEEPRKLANVLVHPVSPGDSLAGISLKYGISLANLRRANHLWASDSIHLRTVLYIPIDQASRINKVQLEAELISVPQDEPNASVKPSDNQVQQAPSEVIQRIPTSQLSFFPPPSNKVIVPAPSAEVSSTNANPVRTSSQSLTSLLTTLPLPGSTRDTFMARLSFESNYSDRDSEVSSEDLELGDVKHVMQRKGNSFEIDGHDIDNDSVPIPVTPKATHRTAHPTPAPESSYSRGQSGIHHFSSSPKTYIPPHLQIRTAQLEPSPIMQVPGSLSRGGSIRGKVKAKPYAPDADFELSNAGSTG